jgi:uncharacterized membrane protein YoaK (UPF0700 family)
MLLSFAHSMSIKQPVALQSMRACVHHLTAVFVDSISTSTARDMGPGLAATTYLTGNQHSQAGKRLRRLELGGWEGVFMTSVLFATHIRGSIRVSTCHESDILLFFLFISLSHSAYALNGPEQIPLLTNPSLF